MKKYLIFGLSALVVIIATLVWRNTERNEPKPLTFTEAGKAVYTCDQGKIIAAIFYESNQPQPPTTDHPIPTGKVEFSLNNGASTTLRQTISGSGVRYADANESIVFWSKGKEAILMRNNVMDLEYKNCIFKD